MAPTIIAPLTLLWVGHFLVDFMLGIWPVYKTMSGLDLAIAGLIAASAAFLGEGMQVVFGSLSDRGFQKALIVFGMVITTASALLGMTQNYLLLTIFYLFTCIGSGAFHPAAASLVNGLTLKRKALFIGIFASGGSLGMAVSQVIFSKLYFVLENQIFYIAFPSLALALILLCLGYFKNEASKNSQPEKTRYIKKFKELFTHKPLRYLYINQVCNQTITWGTIFLLPDVLLSRGFDEAVAFGGGHLAFVLGGALIMVPSGYFADKYSIKHVMLSFTIVGMLAYYAFLFFPGISNTLSLCLLLLMGAAMGVIQPLAVTFGHRLYPSNTGVVSALLMGLVWCVSECLGPAGGGILTKFFTEDAPAKSLAIIGVLFALSVFATARLPAKIKEESLQLQSI